MAESEVAFWILFVLEDMKRTQDGDEVNISGTIYNLLTLLSCVQAMRPEREARVRRGVQLHESLGYGIDKLRQYSSVRPVSPSAYSIWNSLSLCWR